MSGSFAASWLALRGPADAAAVSPVLLARLAAWAGRREGLRVVDLGAGTGAHLRRTAPALPAPQDWTLVERDPTLIAAGSEALRDAGVAWRYRALDLATGLEELAGLAPDLVTASALIDLVSAAWLERLVALRAALGAALYIVLTIDDRLVWSPTDPDDRAVRNLVARHQRRDQGFGPALGGAAPATLEGLLQGGADRLASEASDWRLGPAEAGLQTELLAGYLAAAGAEAPEQAGGRAPRGRHRRGRKADSDTHHQVDQNDLQNNKD